MENINKDKIWNIGKWLGILLVVFVAVLSIRELISLKYIGKDTQIINTISVNGKGEAVSIPDIATFSFSITEKAKTVKEAQTAATTKINDALKAIKANGVAEKDIKTLSYSINPHYEYRQGICTQSYPSICPPGKSVLTGYDVSQTIEVKIRDLEKAGELFDTIGTAGVQTVNGLSFSIDDMDSIKAIARADAINDAKIKAQKIAKELGVRLVRITSFYDSGNDMPYSYDREMGMSADIMMAKTASAPEIPKGEQKVTTNVIITYEIR